MHHTHIYIYYINPILVVQSLKPSHLFMFDAEPKIFPWFFRTAYEATGEVAAAQRAEPGPTEPATLPGGGLRGFPMMA
jgi:hypothetical protein